MKNLARFIALYRPLWPWSLLGGFLALVTLGANIGLMGVSGWFIASMGIAGAAGVGMNYFTPAAIIRGLSIARTAGRYAERVTTHEAALRVTALFRNWFYDRLEQLPIKTTHAMHSGDLWSRLKSDIDALERFYLAFLVPVCVGAVMTPIALAGMWFLFPGMVALHVFAFVLAGIGLPLMAYYLNRQAHARLADAMKTLRIAVADYVQGMDQIMVYDPSGTIQGQLDDQANRIQAIQRKLAFGESIVQAFAMLVVQASVLVSVILGAGMVAQGRLAPALLASLPLLLVAAFDAVLPLVNTIPTMLAARNSADRIFALADQAPGSIASQRAATAISSVVFDKVDFAYDAGRPVLGALSFSFQKGDQLCLWGKSGIGKTSVIQVMTGLWPATGGQILLDGESMDTYDLSSVRRLFGVAEQRPFFFAGTISDNLLRARPDASEADIIDACQTAALWDDIGRMPDRLNTQVGENAARLSGGQARRLAIARAWLKNAPFILLDEPTEGLELDMAMTMMANLQRRARATGRGLLVISHSDEVRSLFARQLLIEGAGR